MLEKYGSFRVSMFALISAIEFDLRRIILLHIAPNYHINVLLTSEELEKCEVRSKKDGKEIDEGDSSTWLSYLDYGDIFQIVRRQSKALPRNIAQSIASITEAFQRSIPVRNAVMHGRPITAKQKASFFEFIELIERQGNAIWSSFYDTSEKLQDVRFLSSFTINLESDTTKIVNNLPSPDFDDTGFVGREGMVQSVRQAILGPFPLISLLGEGGLGKTAIALKTAYELLDDDSSPFEMIIWVSSKSETLTPKEILRIDDAISDSLGLLTRAASVVEAKTGDGREGQDGFGRVLEYMRVFKILLIIDNLETILDKKIIEFSRSVPSGSKILFTTRIGTGIDFPIQVTPFLKEEARFYFRELATSLSAKTLRNLKDQEVDRYCSRLNNNPLFIKWFALSVVVGSPPEKLIEDPKLAIEFCLRNVVDKLSTDERYVAYSIMHFSGPPTMSEIHYLTEVDPAKLATNLQKLIAANIVNMDRMKSGETVYVMNQLPRTYLTKFVPPPPNWASQFIRRMRQLSAAMAGNKLMLQNSQYSAEYFFARSNKDYILIKSLRESLRLIRDGQFAEAEEKLARLRELAPDYFETKRIGAYLAFQTKDFVKAKSLYDEALSEAPVHAPLLYYYGGFLLRAFDDAEGALEQFKKANSIDPDSHEVQLELARANLYCGHFDRALEILKGLETFVASTAPRRFRQIFYDLYVQWHCRRFETAMTLTEWRKAVEILTSLLEKLEQTPSEFIDYKLCASIARVSNQVEKIRDLQIAEKFSSSININEVIGKLIKFGLVSSEKSGGRIDTTSASSGPLNDRAIGYIKVVLIEKSYGFITDENGRDLFFHRSFLSNQKQFAELRPGDRVSFALGTNPQGICATQIQSE